MSEQDCQRNPLLLKWVQTMSMPVMGSRWDLSSSTNQNIKMGRQEVRLNSNGKRWYCILHISIKVMLRTANDMFVTRLWEESTIVIAPRDSGSACVPPATHASTCTHKKLGFPTRVDSCCPLGIPSQRQRTTSRPSQMEVSQN